MLNFSLVERLDRSVVAQQLQTVLVEQGLELSQLKEKVKVNKVLNFPN